MSEDLLKQWRDRVVEAETELNVIDEEIESVQKERKAIKQKIKVSDSRVTKEKQELLKELEDVEHKAKVLAETCDRTLKEKEQVEEVYVRTLDEYEGMHFLVHEIKDAEQELAEREDMDARLQRESLAWAEEEHALRTKLNQLQQQEKQQRKKQQAELAELESQLAEAEKALAHDRSTRVTDMKEKARSIIRSSRPPSPSNKAQANFVTSHVAGGVPTRSCVRTAPTSRATSQNLTGEDGLPLQGNTLDQMRAYSYGANKQSRKRTLLGDATNQQ